MTTEHCESCGMPIETGRYCAHCVDENGELQDFDERLARMTSWQRRSHPEQSEEEATRSTLAYLATMPAWRDHPRVVEAGSAE